MEVVDRMDRDKYGPRQVWTATSMGRDSDRRREGCSDARRGTCGPWPVNQQRENVCVAGIKDETRMAKGSCVGVGEGVEPESGSREGCAACQVRYQRPMHTLLVTSRGDGESAQARRDHCVGSGIQRTPAALDCWAVKPEGSPLNAAPSDQLFSRRSEPFSEPRRRTRPRQSDVTRSRHDRAKDSLT